MSDHEHLAEPRTPPIAVLDSCVIYKPALRDMLMWLASGGVFAPRWTEHIHDEWMGNFLENNPKISLDKLKFTRERMDLIDPLCLVSGYEARISELSLPDPDDRHVLAAAIQANAPHIVTFNSRDFPDDALSPHGVRAVHPDAFLCALFNDEPDAFPRWVREHRTSLKSPPKTAGDYIATVKAVGLDQLARRLEEYRGAI